MKKIEKCSVRANQLLRLSNGLARGLARGLAICLAIALAASFPDRLDAQARVPQDSLHVCADSLGVSFDELVGRHPHIAALAKIAAQQSVTFGIYGGTVRDLYLNRPFTIISDIDLIYASGESGFPEFRNALLDYHHKHRSEMPTPDFHFDLDTQGSPRQEHFHRTGITATKVGILSNGVVLDATGQGVRDLVNRVCRYDSPNRGSVPELHNLGRYARDLARLGDFHHVIGTIIRFRSAFMQYELSGLADGRLLAESREHLLLPDELKTRPVLLNFGQVLKFARDDVRALHHGNLDSLSTAFPLDLLWLDIFKTVTQAPRLDCMRKVFDQIGLVGFLRKIGFGVEIDRIMDVGIDRDDIFEIFEFPGHAPSSPSRALNQRWRAVREQARYHFLFDEFAKTLESNSFARQHLLLRRDAFLSPATYGLVSPGSSHVAEVLAFLDTDISIGILDEPSLRRVLDAASKKVGLRISPLLAAADRREFILRLKPDRSSPDPRQDP